MQSGQNDKVQQKCAVCAQEFSNTHKNAFWGVCPTCRALWNQVADAGIHQVKAFMVNWHEVFVPLTRLVKAGLLPKQAVADLLGALAPHIDPHYLKAGKGHSIHGTAQWPGYNDATGAAVVS